MLFALVFQKLVCKLKKKIGGEKNSKVGYFRNRVASIAFK